MKLKSTTKKLLLPVLMTASLGMTACGSDDNDSPSEPMAGMSGDAGSMAGTAAAGGSAGSDGGGGTAGEASDEKPATVVDVAQSDDNFSSLVAAVVKAELVDTLSDPDANFTVFAPTNAAFEAAFRNWVLLSTNWTSTP